MEITIQAKKIKKIINNLNSIITDFDPINENTGIQIEALENKIIFKAKNKYLSIKDELNIENEQLGGFLIKSKTFNEAISKFDDEMINIKKNENNSITISSEDISYTLNLLNGNFIYVPINLKDFNKIFTIEANQLKEQLKSILFCASDKNPRMILRSINFNIEANTFSLVASDETKIGMSSKPLLNNDQEINFSINLPTIKDLIKIIETGEVDFYLNGQELLLINNNKKISIKVLENTYPKVSKFIPKKFNTHLIIAKDELLKIFNRAMLINNIKSISETPIKLLIKDNNLVLETKDEGIGKAIVKSSNFEVDLNDFYILFNPKFVVETIKAIEDDEINIYFNNSDDPFLVSGKNGDEHKVLILPFADAE